MARSELDEIIAQLRGFRLPQDAPVSSERPLCGMCRAVSAFDEEDPFGVDDPLAIHADPAHTTAPRLLLLWDARELARRAIDSIEMQQLERACAKLREAAEILERVAGRMKSEAA